MGIVSSKHEDGTFIRSFSLRGRKSGRNKMNYVGIEEKHDNIPETQKMDEDNKDEQEHAPCKPREVSQRALHPDQEKMLFENLQKSLQTHCEILMPFTKEANEKGVSKTAGLKDNGTRMIAKSKSSRLLCSFKDLRQNIQTLYERHGIDPSAISMEKLTENIRKFTAEEQVTVQVVCDLSGETIRRVETELTENLKNTLGVKFETCQNVSSIEPTQLTLVICVVVTRLSPDASHAIKGIPFENFRKTALVIIHNKSEDFLPRSISSEVLSDPTFKNLGGIFDIGYTKDLGVYGCTMNSRSLDGLATFISNHTA